MAKKYICDECGREAEVQEVKSFPFFYPPDDWVKTETVKDRLLTIHEFCSLACLANHTVKNLESWEEK